MAKTKALISCAVTAQLICVFVFAYANCWFSHAQIHIHGAVQDSDHRFKGILCSMIYIVKVLKLCLINHPFYTISHAERGKLWHPGLEINCNVNQ